MPLSPRVTASTSLGIGSDVITTSAPLVTSATDLAAVAPRSVQVFERRGVQVEHRHLMIALLDDVAAHGAAHVADADKSYFHDFLPLFIAP